MRESSTDQYSTVSKINHWVTALFFLILLFVGFYLEFGGLSGDEKGPIRDIHKAVGTLFLVWAFWRVTWRLYQGFPKDVSVMPEWQSKAAKAAHWILLLAIIAMPLSGVMGSLFNGYSINIFGIVTIPGLEKNEVIASVAGGVHGLGSKIFAVLILIHIAAAIKHHHIDKDATLTRMTRG